MRVRRIKGREHYEEFHEREWECSFEDPPEEEDDGLEYTVEEIEEEPK